MSWRGGLIGVVVALALLAPAASPAAVGNHDPAFLQVYDNNVENLETVTEFCKGDWQDLVYFMKVQHFAPDLVLVQQVSGRAQLNELVKFMSRNLPGRYKGVIARRNPRPFDSPCNAPKALQTNAIVFRVGRFAVQPGSKLAFRSTRRVGNGCGPETLDRSENVLVRLTDKINGQTVVVGSIHWPTGNRAGPACANNNARQAAKRMAAAGPAGLRIFGGDANTTPGSWTQRITGRFGYGDAAALACGGNAGCLAQNWTVGGDRRIDFLFSRHEPANAAGVVSDFTTVSFEAANAAAQQVSGGDDPLGYSDHRALAARVHY